MKSKWKKVLSLLMSCVLLIGCIPVLSGCGSKKDENTVKVGICLPLTGDSAKSGQEFQDAATLALEECDYKAGDYTIDVVWVDVTSDPEKGTLALEQAIVKDQIDVALLNWNSSVAIACMDVVAKYKIPWYFGLAASDEVDIKLNSDEKYNYYMCKGWPSFSLLVGTFSEFVDNLIETGKWTPETKNLALFGDDTDAGYSVAATIKTGFEDIGFTTVYEDYFALNSTDMYAPLTKIKEAGANVLCGEMCNPACSSAILKTQRELNMNNLTLARSLTDSAGWYELCGEASDYVFDMNPKLTSERALKFIDEFSAKYGYEPAASCGGLVYDYTRFFCDIVKACGEKYGEVNSETLYTYGVEDMYNGSLSFTDGVTCQNYVYSQESKPNPVIGSGYYEFPVIQLYEGESYVVWPESVAEAEVRIPDYAK